MEADYKSSIFVSIKMYLFWVMEIKIALFCVSLLEKYVFVLQLIMLGGTIVLS